MKNTFYCQYCLTHKDLIDYSQERQDPNLKIKICNQCHAEGRNTAEYKAAQNLARIEKQKERYRNDPEFRARQKAKQKERYDNDPEYKKRLTSASVDYKRRIAKAAFDKSSTAYCVYCREHLSKLHFTEDQLVYGVKVRTCVDCLLNEKQREEEKEQRRILRESRSRIKQAKRTSVPPEYGGGKERDLQKYIQDRIGGEIEVQNDAGVIDILTPTRLIEIKVFHGWKECLGQLNAYQFAHSMDLHNLHLHKPTAVLFWECTPGVPTDLMFATFKHYNIELFTTWSKDEHSLQHLLDNG